MIVYTSITKNYLPKARVLARSLKRRHPDWPFYVVLCDSVPADFDISREPFDHLWTLEGLGLPNWRSWAFEHDLVELCTSVKGFAAQKLATANPSDRVMYLDPDIKVYSSLEALDALLNDHEVLLTPHLLTPERDEDAVIDNEISALKHGAFNLGFFASRCDGQGRDFIDWWAKRLERHCVADIANGLFTDQKWMDLAPAMFDRLHIVRDPGYNVATWNIRHRPISRSANGEFLAGGVPLRFYHFTGYDSGDGRGMLSKYASNQIEALKLWEDYAEDLAGAGHGDAPLMDFAYSCFSNGALIDRDVRKLYRSRPDLREAFPDPFEVRNWSLYAWWRDYQAATSDGAEPTRRPISTGRTPVSILASIGYSACSKAKRLSASILNRLQWS